MTKRHHRARAVGAAQRPPQPESVVFLSPDDLKEVFGQNRSVGEDTVKRLPLPVRRQWAELIETLLPDTKEKPVQGDPSEPKSDTAVDEQPSTDEQPKRNRRLKYDVTEPCRFCHEQIGVYGLPRHESWCKQNPDAKQPGDEARPKEPIKSEHTDDEYGTCDLCGKRMLKNSIGWHKRKNCRVAAFLAQQNEVGIEPPSVEETVAAIVEQDKELLDRLAAPAPEPQPLSPSDEDLLEMLELVIPAIKPSTFSLVTEWVALTRRLMEANQ